MVLRKYQCEGRPYTEINSLPGKKTKYAYGEVILLHDKDMTPELKEKIRMGLIKRIGRVVSAVKKSWQEPPTPSQPPVKGAEVQKAVQDALDAAIPTLIDASVNKAMKEAFSKLDLSGVSTREDRAQAPVKRKKRTTRKAAPKLETSTAFVRPDAEDIKGEFEVKGEKSSGSGVSDAISKLKKKGK